MLEIDLEQEIFEKMHVLKHAYRVKEVPVTWRGRLLRNIFDVVHGDNGDVLCPMTPHVGCETKNSAGIEPRVSDTAQHSIANPSSHGFVVGHIVLKYITCQTSQWK